MLLLFSSMGHSAPNDVLICVGREAHAGDVAQLLVIDVSESGYTATSRIDCGVGQTVSSAELMTETGVQALISLSDPDGLVDIWVRDRLRNTIVNRRIDMKENDVSETSVAALRIAELLRAIFVEQKNTPWKETSKRTVKQPPPSKTESGDVERNKKKDDTGALTKLPTSKPSTIGGKNGSGPIRRFLLSVDGTISFPSLHHPPTAHLLLSGHLFLRRCCGVEVLAFIPLLPLTIEEAEGDIILTQMSIGVGLTLSRCFAERWYIMAGVGVLLGGILVRGDARAGYRASERAVFSVMPYGRLSISIRIFKRVFWGLGVLAAAPLPETHITAGDRVVLTLSPVFLRGYTGVNIEFP